MRRVIVRYRVKPHRVAENEELVRAVYAELATCVLTGCATRRRSSTTA